MAIIDAALEFSTDQAVTAAAASENVVDISDARDIGVGKKMFVVIVVKESFTDTGSNSTLSVKVQTDDNEAFGSPSDVADLLTIPALAAAGTQYVLALPAAVYNDYQQYVRLYYTPNNGDLSAGKLDAFVTLDPTQYKQYASGWSVD